MAPENKIRIRYALRRFILAGVPREQPVQPVDEDKLENVMSFIKQCRDDIYIILSTCRMKCGFGGNDLLDRVSKGTHLTIHWLSACLLSYWPW